MKNRTLYNPICKPPQKAPEMPSLFEYGNLSKQLMIPRLKIIQPTSKSGNPGRFHMGFGDEDFEKLHIVVVKINLSRVKWDRADMNNDRPVCSSSNYLTPDAEVQNPVSQRCARFITKAGEKLVEPICPDCTWQAGMRPVCDDVYNLLGIRMPDLLPFWLRATGASIPSVKWFWQATELHRKNGRLFETTISLSEKRIPFKHYQLQFSSPRLLTQNFAKSITGIVGQLRSTPLPYNQTVH